MKLLKLVALSSLVLATALLAGCHVSETAYSGSYRTGPSYSTYSSLDPEYDVYYDEYYDASPRYYANRYPSYRNSYRVNNTYIVPPARSSSRQTYNYSPSYQTGESSTQRQIRQDKDLAVRLQADELGRAARRENQSSRSRQINSDHDMAVRLQAQEVERAVRPNGNRQRQIDSDRALATRLQAQELEAAVRAGH